VSRGIVRTGTQYNLSVFLVFLQPALNLRRLNNMYHILRIQIVPRNKLHFSIPTLTLPNPIFLPHAYSPALIYFGRERGWWITCNYPTVLKEENRNRKSTTWAICLLDFVQHYDFPDPDAFPHVVRSTDFSQQIAQVVLFLFMFLSFKTVG
jgi:hypothetical protein